MLSIYTRHSATCPKKVDIHWKRCRCPKWINGLLNGQFIRKTANTRSWEKAEDTKRQWERADKPEKDEPVRIEDAIDSYLVDAKARELKPATLYKLEGIFRKQFLTWSKEKGLRFLKELNVALLREFRATWQDAPLAKKKSRNGSSASFGFASEVAGSLRIRPSG